MPTIVETLPNNVSSSLAWGKITGKLRNGFALVEVRAKVMDGQSVWELSSHTTEPPSPPASPTPPGG